MDCTQYQALLAKVVAIAQKAGEEILKIYAEPDFAMTLKSDQSPLTRADLQSHGIIVRELAKLEPRLPILSEEAATDPYETRRDWQAYWLVDPLDGTKEFIKRSGDFTVNIALVENGRPCLGVVYAPVKQLLYYALQGQGAFRKQHDREMQRIQARGYRETQPLRVVASQSHRGEMLEHYLRALPQHVCISMGSSLKLCLVADGSADLYPRLGPTMEWDTAAAQCVVECAGGQVTSLDGQPLRYNKPDLLNPFFMVSGNPAFPWQTFLSSFQEYEA